MGEAPASEDRAARDGAGRELGSGGIPLRHPCIRLLAARRQRSGRALRTGRAQERAGPSGTGPLDFVGLALQPSSLDRLGMRTLGTRQPAAYSAALPCASAKSFSANAFFWLDVIFLVSLASARSLMDWFQ